VQLPNLRSLGAKKRGRIGPWGRLGTVQNGAIAPRSNRERHDPHTVYVGVTPKFLNLFVVSGGTAAVQPPRAVEG
jgi:hypothetical protein